MIMYSIGEMKAAINWQIKWEQILDTKRAVFHLWLSSVPPFLDSVRDSKGLLQDDTYSAGTFKLVHNLCPAI